jgi:hypothetical protein
MIRERIEIQLSKKKMIFLILAAFGFVSLGFIFIVNPEKFASGFFRSPLVIKSVGIAGVLFFGAAGIYGIRKLSDKRPGLVIDAHGITDHTHAYSVGLIEWKDITKIESSVIAGSVFFVVHVIDNEKYLQQSKGLRRKLMEFNLSKYGSPLTISATALNMKVSELEQLLLQQLMENKKVF